MFLELIKFGIFNLHLFCIIAIFYAYNFYLYLFQEFDINVIIQSLKND